MSRQKKPQADCLSRIKTKDDEETAFVDFIEMDAEQDDADYSSRSWQLYKLQRVKLRDSLQNDKLLKNVNSWVQNKK